MWGLYKPPKDVRGWGPWRQTWYAICSEHQQSDPECELCQRGYWSNDLNDALESLVAKHVARLWLWWMNRRWQKHIRQQRKRRQK